MSLTEKAQREIMDSLHESALVLAENSSGLFCAYEPDVRRFGYQTLSIAPSSYRIDGRPIKNVDESDAIASVVDPRYVQLPKALEDYDNDNNSLTQIGHVLRSGQNAAIGMGHAELIDIALFSVGVSNHFRRKGIEHKSVLVASKAMDFLGINIESLNVPQDLVSTMLKGLEIELEPDNTVPVRQFLSLANHATYLTIPDTKTFSSIRGMQSAGIKFFNSHSTSAIGKDLDRHNEGKNDPILLNVALPGTTVKQLDTEKLDDQQKQDLGVESGDKVHVIGRINPSIGRFMGQVLLYASEVRLDHQPPALAIDKDFVCVKDDSDVALSGEKLVGLSESLDDNYRYVYDKDGDLPVVRR